MTIKNLLPLLLIIFTISVFVGCQSNSQTTKKSKTEQRKKLNKVKKADKKKNAKPKPLPLIGKLKKSTKQTKASIYSINKNKTAKDKQPFRLTEKNIVIKGTAIDKPRKTRAAGVYVKIGEQFFKAKYGEPSKPFAERTKNPKYNKVGFTANIPKHKIKKGDYEVSLCVVSRDRKTYYEHEGKVKIKVR